jgi:hypothetical protein
MEETVTMAHHLGCPATPRQQSRFVIFAGKHCCGSKIHDAVIRQLDLFLSGPIYFV